MKHGGDDSRGIRAPRHSRTTPPRGLGSLLALTLVGVPTVAALAGCADPGDALRLSGSVDDPTVTVQAPALAAPTVDLDAGFHLHP